MRLRCFFPLLASAVVAAGCSFPEDDYGFGPAKGADATTDTNLPEDAASEDASQLPDTGADEDASDELAQEAGEDVVTQEADAPVEAGPDTTPEVGPDVAPDAPKDVAPDVLPDVAPDTSLPLLNVWHIPTASEPQTVTMRNPRFPAASGTVYVYFGVQPDGLINGGNLHWWWSGETTPHTVAFAFDSKTSSNAYWVASFQMPARPVGTFRYYIEVTPSDPQAHATTWLYGTDTTTNTSASKTVAAASPYKPDVRLPVGGGDAGVAEVVISEAMINALGGTGETAEEWVELYCAASVPVTLDGCKFGDATLHTMSAPELILWPGVHAVLGNTGDSAHMGGFTADYSYGATNVQFANNNSPGDQIRLLLPNDGVIDQVVYGSGWTGSLFTTDAHSMQFKIKPPNATDNDLPANWCLSQKSYGLGTSYGTPQAPTDLCAP